MLVKKPRHRLKLDHARGATHLLNYVGKEAQAQAEAGRRSGSDSLVELCWERSWTMPRHRLKLDHARGATHLLNYVGKEAQAQAEAGPRSGSDSLVDAAAPRRWAPVVCLVQAQEEQKEASEEDKAEDPLSCYTPQGQQGHAEVP